MSAYLLGKFYSLCFKFVVIRFLFSCHNDISCSRIDYDYIKILENRLSTFMIQHHVNYNMCGASVHDAAHDTAHDTSVISKQNLLLEFCADPKSRDEMQAYIDVSSRSHFSKYYLKPLLSSGKLEMMFPDKPKSKNQKYTTVHSK